MARVNAAKSSAPARVRFVMLEADLPEGGFDQLAQVFQNALRPAGNIQVNTKTAASLPQRAAAAETDVTASANDNAEEAVVDTGVAEMAPTVSKPKGTRAPARTPKVLDLDLSSGVSFETFASAKNPASDLKKFLVVAAWFKQHRNLDEITADHVYTCYRAIKWQSAISDFSQPLRNLKHQQLMEQKNKGLYAINHLGMAEVDKLG